LGFRSLFGFNRKMYFLCGLRAALFTYLQGFAVAGLFPKDLNAGAVAKGAGAAPVFGEPGYFAAFWFGHGYAP
jgi:hypothetical protein